MISRWGDDGSGYFSSGDVGGKVRVVSALFSSEEVGECVLVSACVSVRVLSFSFVISIYSGCVLVFECVSVRRLM